MVFQSSLERMMFYKKKQKVEMPKTLTPRPDTIDEYRQILMIRQQPQQQQKSKLFMKSK